MVKHTNQMEITCSKFRDMKHLLCELVLFLSSITHSQNLESFHQLGHVGIVIIKSHLRFLSMWCLTLAYDGAHT